jgi:hypothetical protein
LEKLKERLARLDSFIQQGELLLRDAESKDKSTTMHQLGELKAQETIWVTKKGLEPPAWERARQIMSETGKPMKLSEIAKEFHARNWQLSVKNGTEVLRSALNKRPEMFKYDKKHFRYCLRAVQLAVPSPANVQGT